MSLFQVVTAAAADVPNPPTGSYTLFLDTADGIWKKKDDAGVVTAASPGEVNTASNVGTGGVGVFKQKTGNDLEFKKINAGSNKITIGDDPANSEVDIDIDEANLSDFQGAGTHGLVPNSTTETGKFLQDDGTWVIPSASVNTDNTLWVAESGGTAHGSRTTELSDPYTTIAGALGDALTGDTVKVLPGTYAEVGLTIPAGVSLVSEGGYEVTSITGGGATTGTRVTLSSGSVIQGFTVTIPTDATYGITYAGGGGTVAGARFVKFEGQSGTADGSGLVNTGAGKIVAFEVRYGSNDCENILLCTGGILAIQSLHVPGTGAIKRGAKVTNGRLQALDMNIGNANVIYGVEIGAAGVAVLISLNLFNLKNGLLFSANDIEVDALGGKIQTTSTVGGTYGGGIDSFTGRSVVVTATENLASSTIRISAQMEPNFVFNNTLNPNAAGSDFTVSLIQGNTDERDVAQRLFGVDSQIGFPERGAQFMSGEGGANATFNKVVQMDAAGTTFTDITDEAASKSGSTFTFLTAAGLVDESIAWCSTRRTIKGVALKHWGIVLETTLPSAGVGTYVFEYYSGAATYSAAGWTEVSVQALSLEEQYNYANDIFIRPGTTEHIRIGVDDNTAWTTTTIDGQEGYWARMRLDSDASISATPTFQQLKVTPSHFMLNSTGQMTAHGLAMWRSDLFGVGNVWGEITGGGAKDAEVAVGSGAAPAGWTQKIKKGRFDSDGDSISFQFAIPDGLCTAYPLYFNLTYSLTADTPSAGDEVDLILSTLVFAVGGVLIADPLGAKVPIPRAIVNAEGFEDKAATEFAVSTPLGNYDASPQVIQFGPVDISSYYDGDLVVMRLEMDDDGSAAPDFVIWTLSVEGVRFTSGKPLQD